MNVIHCLNEKEKAHLQYIPLKKGDILFHENDLCHTVGIVISGSVRISSFSYDGKEIIYNTLKEDGVFGNSLLFSSEPYYKGNVTALEESVIALIEKDVLFAFLSENTVFFEAYMQIQSDFTKALNSRIRLLSISSARERLLFYLHSSSTHSVESSVSSLAEELNLSREALSRTLSALRKEGLIRMEKKTISLL